jgi:hypothetical protein
MADRSCPKRLKPRRQQLPFSDSAGRDNDLVQNSDAHLERTRIPVHGQSVKVRHHLL